MSHYPSRYVAIFAGGNGTRLGGINKSLMPIGGIPAYQHVLAKLQPDQNTSVIINTRHSPSENNTPSYPSNSAYVIAADSTSFGPFSGLLAILQAIPAPLAASTTATTAPQTPTNDTPISTLLTAPCDAVHLPANYAAIMHAALQHHSVVYAQHHGQIEPLCMGLHVSQSLRQSAKHYFDAGHRSVKGWLRAQNAHAVDFSGNDASAIWSVNTPEERLMAEATLAAASPAPKPC